jgi:hypothetical protein
MMTTLFKAIEILFVNYLFLPFDSLRAMENWWLSNAVNGFFMLLGASAMVYWMLQLKSFNDSGEEKTDVSAHSYI